MKRPRNAVYGGFLYWYSGHYTGFYPRKPSWYERHLVDEFRVLYVGSTDQADVETRHRQHYSKGHSWAKADWNPNTIPVPTHIRLVVAEEALRMVLRPVYNDRRACASYSDAEWRVTLPFVLGEVAGASWLPEHWRTSVCAGGSGRYGPFFNSACHRGGCVVPEGCSLLTRL